MRILIVEDGFQRGVIAATRALGAFGHEVGIADPVRGHSARSRFSSRWHQVPNPSAPDFIEHVNQIVRGNGYDIVFAGDDEYLWALSLGRDGLDALFPYPEHPSLARAVDKISAGESAKEFGLKTPVISDPSQDLPPGPYFIKERVHTNIGGESRFNIVLASTPDEVHRVLNLDRSDRRDLFVQQFVPGRLFAVAALCDPEKGVIYLSQQESSHTFPSGAGVTTRAEIVCSDHSLERKVSRFLEHLGWVGMVQLQFIKTPDGDYYFLDLNGRFYGSMQLVISEGANLPAAWVALVTGTELPVMRPARPGTRYQWLEGDIRRSLERENGSLAEIVSCLAFARRARHSMWSMRDPNPVVTYVLRYFGRSVRKRLPFGRYGSAAVKATDVSDS